MKGLFNKALSLALLISVVPVVANDKVVEVVAPVAKSVGSTGFRAFASSALELSHKSLIKAQDAVKGGFNWAVDTAKAHPTATKIALGTVAVGTVLGTCLYTRKSVVKKDEAPKAESTKAVVLNTKQAEALLKKIEVMTKNVQVKALTAMDTKFKVGNARASALAMLFVCKNGLMEAITLKDQAKIDNLCGTTQKVISKINEVLQSKRSFLRRHLGKVTLVAGAVATAVAYKTGHLAKLVKFVADSRLGKFVADSRVGKYFTKAKAQ